MEIRNVHTRSHASLIFAIKKFLHENPKKGMKTHHIVPKVRFLILKINLNFLFFFLGYVGNGFSIVGIV